MIGADYVREALAIIEAQVTQEISGRRGTSQFKASDLAARIGYSVQHFARLFRSLTGESPADYIQKRRLTEVARRILVEPTPVGAIARAAGWADYETFSRAFKRHFGTSPSRARSVTDLARRFREPISPAELSTSSNASSSLAPTSSGAMVRLSEPRVCDDEERYLVGLPFFMDRGVKSYHRPWAIFDRALALQSGSVANRILPERFYQFSSWLDDESADGLFILCAVQVEHPGEERELTACVKPPFAWRRVPPCRFLVFTHRGGVSNLTESYRQIYGSALAASEFVPSFSWELQCCLPSGDIEIAIPVAKD